MLFCPTCGNILLLKKGTGSLIYFCKTCPYIFNINQKIERIETFDDKKEVDLIINEKEDKKNLPTMEINCPKCGHNKAYYSEMQIRSADEPSTHFYQCEKCSNRWREG